jgi:hypothetical protein
MVMSVAHSAMTMPVFMTVAMGVAMIVPVFVLCVFGHDSLSYHFK